MKVGSSSSLVLGLAVGLSSLSCWCVHGAITHYDNEADFMAAALAAGGGEMAVETLNDLGILAGPAETVDLTGQTLALTRMDLGPNVDQMSYGLAGADAALGFTVQQLLDQLFPGRQGAIDPEDIDGTDYIVAVLTTSLALGGQTELAFQGKTSSELLHGFAFTGNLFPVVDEGTYKTLDFTPLSTAGNPEDFPPVSFTFSGFDANEFHGFVSDVPFDLVVVRCLACEDEAEARTLRRQLIDETDPPVAILNMDNFHLVFEDLCPDDDDKVVPGVCGCNVPDDDTDSDGTEDCIDPCPEDSDKTDPGQCGCGVPDSEANIADPDSDGVINCNDQCPDNADKTAPGECGCELPDEDSDSDGVLDCDDGCPDNPDKTEAGQCGCDSDKMDPGQCGCEVPDTDTDSDGVADCNDLCPEDPNKTEPDICACGEDIAIDDDSDGIPDCTVCANPGVCGCGVPEDDSDSDGTPDCIDLCPDDADKTEGGMCGCKISDDDSDSDGTADCNDGCPDDPDKVEPGMCGCNVSDDDSDSDGTPDCKDDCPDDPDKTEPGMCDCNIPDDDSDSDGIADCNDACPDDPDTAVDTDSDGVPDCKDECPEDPDKTEPGVCGCNESDKDSDSDGIPDCDDECPNDPNKTEAGVCGCDVSDEDEDSDGVPTCNDGCPTNADLTAPEGFPFPKC